MNLVGIRERGACLEFDEAALTRPIRVSLGEKPRARTFKVLLEEVVNEVYLILRERPPGFDPQRAPAHVYLRMIVRDAVKRVAADYCPPGRKTRAASTDIEERRGALLTLEAKSGDRFDSDSEEQPGPMLSFEVEAADGFDCDHRAELTIYQRCDVRTIFDRAPRMLASALVRLYCNGESTEDVAASMGITRFALARQIKAFAGTFRGAAPYRAIAA